MNLAEAQQKFIQSWGVLGSSWGINRTMALVHALLLISPEALSTEDIMSALNISRGNANMSLRALIDWGIIGKSFKAGERMEFFQAEKNLWELSKQVAKERRKRELEPVLKMLGQVKDIQDTDSEALREFKKVTKNIDQFAHRADQMLNVIEKADEHWFFSLWRRKKNN
ncbi:MAG: GbsR/MarR family transcriptional regulator [Cyclobacteriaceae bacterium]